MNVTSLALPDVFLIEPRLFRDDRGFFLETFHSARYAAAGIPGAFLQDNHSHSAPGTVRGLHYQLRHPQAKIVRCVRGRIFDVAVDIRRSSATFRRWIGVELSEANHLQLFIPAGFAHGFCVPDVESDVEYKCTSYYDPADDRGVLWNDPSLGIAWPVHNPIVSQKDQSYAPLSLARDDLPD